MHEDKPFIHLMKTPYGNYIYDVNTNSILRVIKSIYDYLAKQQNMLTEINEVNNDVIKEINHLKNYGFLLSHRPKEIIHPLDKKLEYYLGNKVHKITLQVTQNCNFRCSYCIYSELDNKKQRKHSSKRMTFEKAKKAIDFLINHSRDQEDINIGFYGGEPLLEIDLIKKCVLYSKSVSDGKSVSFTITTNGSLLSPDIASFFTEHDVHTIISLDGPPQIQDKHRRFAANGCGTFEKIAENINNIINTNYDFYKKLTFNVVIDPQDSFSCLNEFLLDYHVFKDTEIRTPFIDDSFTNERVYFSNDFLVNYNYEYFKMLLNKVGRFEKGNFSPLAKIRFAEVENKTSEMRNMKRLPDIMSHSGPCIPGARKLFVNVNGDFFPCERVSELSDVMKIGNLDEGFNVKKVRDLLNIAKLTEEKCKDCWVIANCSACAKYADNINSLSSELKSAYCFNIKSTYENALLDFIAVNEAKTLNSERETR